MRFTIERMRTLVLAAGVLLVVALAAFLTVGKWRGLLRGTDLPKRLGINVVQEGQGVTYADSRGGHVVFKIHARSAEQLKSGHLLLHGVQIEYFSQDGHTLDSISGSDFEYDQKSGVGMAQGQVEISLTRPPEPPAGEAARLPEVPAGVGTVHVVTSGLSFNQNTGVLTTAKKLTFSMASGSGSAVGAKYDSDQGHLVLDHAVELATHRGGQKVLVHAQHAEFERDAQVCSLTNATTEFQSGQASAGHAKILFGHDGAAQKLDAENGFTLTTNGGGRATAPEGTLLFGARNQPKSGEMRGGVSLQSENGGKQLQGTAPSAELQFGAKGELQQVALRQGVEMQSSAESMAGGEKLRVSRTWRSPEAQVNFRDVGNGKIVPAELRGTGGVVVASQTQRGKTAPVPARLAADEVTGEFGPDGELTAMDGVGHASMEQTLGDGAREKATGEKIEARFARAGEAAAGNGKGVAAEIQSAVIEGNVVLVEQPGQKGAAQAQAPLRATAGRATYEDAGQTLRLTENPRVESSGLELTARAIDVSQQTGKAFAHGDVKATWLETGAASAHNSAGSGAAPAMLTLGGQAPAHVIADEAQFNRTGGEAVFRGHARLWQDANSISGAVIVLNRDKQTLVAKSDAHGEPVEAVLLGTRDAALGIVPHATKAAQGKSQSTPAVIRVRGGEFNYSDAEHRAVMTGGSLGQVMAYAGGATCTAQQVVLMLRPRGNSSAAGEVERVTASGDVVVKSQGRQGAGSKLVYSSLTGEYALTGTPAEPPRLFDPERGTVTGAALIFNSRNDSVSIEGSGHETRMETTAPR